MVFLEIYGFEKNDIRQTITFGKCHLAQMDSTEIPDQYNSANSSRYSSTAKSVRFVTTSSFILPGYLTSLLAQVR
jgi:hypothetical protein